MIKGRVIKVVGVLMVNTSFLLGANVPNIDNIIKEVKPLKDINSNNKKDTVEIKGINKYQAAMVDDKSGKKIYIKEFIFAGNINVKQEKLKKLVKDYENRSLGFKELTDVTSIITKHYRDNGYFVARAYLPVQDVKKNNNIFEIAIIEGEYDKFNIKNESRVNNTFLQNSFNKTKKENNNIVNSNALERTMLIVDEYPGVKINSIEVKPGDEIGTSSFDINVDRRSFVDGYVVTDNYGSRYSGRERLMGGVNLNSTLKVADQLSFFGVVSKKENLKNGLVSYSLPLNYDGLRAEVSYSTTDYDLNNVAGGYNGESEDLNLALSYPIIKTREEKLDLKTTFGTREQKDYQEKDLTTNKELNSINISVNYAAQKDVFGLNGLSESSVGYVIGNLKLKNEDAKTQDNNGAKTQGKYDKVEAKSSLNLELVESLNFINSVKVQHVIGNKNLDGIEDFSIGGIDGVRFYPSTEESAENGFIYSTQLLKRLPAIMGIGQSVELFYDVGLVRMQNSDYDAEYKRRTLQDVGLGYYMNYRTGFLKVYSAWGINEEVESESNYDNRVMFQTGVSF